MKPKPKSDKSWLDIALGASALLVSAISLWVAIGTEDANRKMVSAASWPLIQFIDGDADPDTRKPILTLSISNAGVGPAKLETFELFYKGRAMRNELELLKACCGFVRPQTYDDSTGQLLNSTVQNTVLRAGETRPFLIYTLGTANRAMWDKVVAARQDIRHRVCYCSVFDECWLTDESSTKSLMRPKPVKECAEPPVSYLD